MRPARAPRPPRQKTHLTVDDLPFETLPLEINGRPYYVVLRDRKVYMAQMTPSIPVRIRRVKARGAKETALELAQLIHQSGREWPDRHVALACNWPNTRRQAQGTSCGGAVLVESRWPSCPMMQSA